MRITSAKEKSVSIASEIKNAYIDFSKMTVSVLALETDMIRDGKPVVGYGFNSNGRYAQSGLLNDRFLPRLMEADPKILLDDTGENLDPFKVRDAVMANEKPGGHGERSVAVGVIDMAVWDLVSKMEGKPLCRLLAERFRGGPPDEKVFVYAAGGYYYAGKGNDELRREMAGYLDGGYSVVKMKIGAAPLEQDLGRIQAVIDLIAEKKSGFKGSPASRLAVDANGRFNLAEALSTARALEPLGLFWFEEAGDPLDYALQIGRAHV